MSTLTKILIVLLTLSSIFVCGIVVTYVGTATNYKDALQDRKDEINRLKSQKDGLQEDLDNNITSTDEQIAFLEGQKAKLEEELLQNGVIINDLESKLGDAESRVQNIEKLVTSLNETVNKNNQVADDAHQKAIELEAENIEHTATIEELQQALLNSYAQLEQLNTTNKQLIEQNTSLQDKLDNYLQTVGLRSGTPQTVTRDSGVTIAPPIKNIDIEGRISEVSLSDSLASIAIGSSDGVTKGMRFHVVRGTQFICDIVVFEVDADRASGIIELVSEGQPQIGDIVKTNL